MKLIDTHTHLYLPEFQEDIQEVIQRAIHNKVDKILLPNIDKDSIAQMKALKMQYPNHVFSMMGLHPTSVKEDYKEQLIEIESELNSGVYIAVGEIGIDLYWDKSFFVQQQDAFRIQLEMAIKYNLPVAIHSRDSFEEIIEILDEFPKGKIRGVFHCFSGDARQAIDAVNRGFLLGIGGVVTFKNSGLDMVLETIELKNLLIETDAPFLAPTPYRGKRNESSYCTLIAEKIASIYHCSIDEVARVTTQNAEELFGI